MKLTQSPWLKIILYTSFLAFISNQAEAQITPDNTLGNENSRVTRENIKGIPSDRIDGGATRGSNLFHSFREFNINAGRGAYFANPAGIENIFSRVTGNNISNILGRLGVLGNANLFFINPNGIFFGDNASLDIGGSFFGSTADSLLFDNGEEFSAVDPENTSTLTINAPIGFSLRDNPQPIVIRTTFNDLGWQVNTGENITFVGGNINFEGGKIFAPGGRVELGGLSAAGKIGITENGSLTFPDGIDRADIFLTDNASVNVAADGGGFININARNLTLLKQSQLFAGIAENKGSPDAIAGDITINATESIQLTGNGMFENPESELDTGIRNFVGLPSARRNNPEQDSTAKGNGGSIFINTDLLEIRDRAALSAKTYSQGNAGNVIVKANNIFLDGGGIFSQARAGSEGNSGNINITTSNLKLTVSPTNPAEGSSFIITDNQGSGNAGNITINASDSISFEGFNLLLSEIASGIRGNAGDITINTGSLNINGGQIQADNQGIGDAGNITINAEEEIAFDGSNLISQLGDTARGNAGNINISGNSLIIDNNTQLLTENEGKGNSGNISLNATDSILIQNSPLPLLSEIGVGVEGNSGDITINTGSFTVTDALIQATNQGRGNAGNITINANDQVSFSGVQISSQVLENAIGNAGNIKIAADSLIFDNNTLLLSENRGIGEGGNVNIDAGSFQLNNKSSIQSSTRGNGNAGDITINATREVSLDKNSTFLSQVFANANGRGGTINIFSPSISLNDFALISTNTQQGGRGEAGNIKIETDTLKLSNGAVIDALTENNFNGGAINITASILDLSSGGKIVTSSDSSGNAGNINLTIADNIIINNSNPPDNPPFLEQILQDLKFETGLFGNNFSSSTGNGGSIFVKTNSIELENNGSISAATGSGEGGNITLQIDDTLLLKNNSLISAEATQEANGGNINIDAKFIVAFPSKFDGNDILASAAEGRGGNIQITAESVFGIQEHPQNPFTNDIDASSKFGLDGSVSINTPDTDAIQGVTELETNVIKVDKIATQVCPASGAVARNSSSFTINGRGGLPQQPTDPLSADALLIGGEIRADRKLEEVEEESFATLVERTEPLNPEEIIPARGMIVKPNGDIILTGYPTPNVASRTPNYSPNCSSLTP